MQRVVHPAAERELNEAFDWCQARFGNRVAARLLRRVELAGRLLMRQPGFGTPAAGGARTLPLRQFPYTLVYRVDGDVLQVLALQHQSRMPGYWVARLRG